jgi:hypothetical protein
VSGILDDAFKDLQSMMQGAASADVVHKAIAAYDGFATAAMQVLLKHMPKQAMSYEQVAEYAWTVADAMMAERRKRGLGATAPAPPPPPPVEVVQTMPVVQTTCWHHRSTSKKLEVYGPVSDFGDVVTVRELTSFSVTAPWRMDTTELLRDYVREDQWLGYLSKGYGCINPAVCKTAHPHSTTNCSLDGIL